MKCIIDAKVDTGSFATVVSSTTMAKLDLVPFTEDLVELANGEPAVRSLGDFSFNHLKTKDGQVWVAFRYQLLEEDWLV